MNNRIFLIFLLVTPLIVIIGSTLAFNLGYSPENTKNNGTFFDSYFEVDPMSLVDESGSVIEFEDGKWLLGVYYNNDLNFENALYVMRQLNVALNRDIYRVKRVAFFSNLQLKNEIDNLILEYPRTELVNDKNGVLINVLQKNSKMDMFQENPIFIIDPYGRAVMYFEPSTDPKKILKDLKVLI